MQIKNDLHEEERFSKVKEMNAAEAEQQKTTTGDGSGVRLSIVSDSKGRKVVMLDRDIFKNITDLDERSEALEDWIIQNFGGTKHNTSDFFFVVMNERTAGKMKFWNENMDAITYERKLSAAEHIDELIKISNFDRYSKNFKDKHKVFAEKGWNYFKSYFTDGKRVYEADISVAKSNEQSVVYNIGYIKDMGKYESNNKSSYSLTGSPNESVTILRNEASNRNSMDSIPEKGQPVNSNSMQTGKKYSFPGPKALTANLENLEKAKEREKSSDKEESDSENIRRELDWFRGMDRMWRYEISDKDAKINILTPEYKKLVDELNAIKMDNNSSFSVEALNRIDEIINSMTKVNKYRAVKTLGDILEHDRLYETYPELADYKVEIVELKNGEAEFDPKTQTIKINKNSISTIDTATIMHEVQHAIQDIEGFASGSSEAYWESIDKQHTEKLAEFSETLKEIEARGGKKLVDLSLKYLDNFEKISNNDPNSEQLQREREEIEEQAKRKGCYRLLKSLSVQRIEARALEKKLALFDSDYERYYNTAGEIEARNVEERLTMTDDEREAERPDIDRKKVAFVESKFRAAKGESLDELAESKGYSQKLYHQTGDNFTVFDTEHQKAGKYDPEMPTGTFLKPNDADIGLEGNKQMELYTKIKNPLQFKDRADAVRFWKKNVTGYAEAVRKIDRINEQYSKEVARAGMEVSEYKREWRRNNPDADSRELYNDAEFQRLDETEDIIVEEWDSASNEASFEAKELIDTYMRDSGYDGVVVEKDQGSFGRTVKTYIVFDSSQMKSTDTVTYDDNGNEIPLSARFDSSKKDIRYSLPERRSEISKDFNSEEYDKLVSKKAIKLSKQEWSKINSQRTKRYADIAAENIPTLDLFRFAEYNKIDEAYSYVIRNIDKYTFSVISKSKIDASKKEIFKERKKVYESTNRQNVENENTRRVDRRGDNLARHGRTIREDEFGFRQTSEFELNNDFRQGASNIGGDVKLSLPEHPTPLQIGDAYKNGEITQEEYVDRINELWEETGKAEGTINPGEIVEPPNKRVPTPKSVSDGTKVRQFARTILESGYATPEMEAYLKELILEGDFSYTPTSNEKTLEKARKNIESQGYGNAKYNWQREITQSGTGVDAVATGEALLRLALQHNDAVEAVNIAADLAEFGTRTAQSLQAFSLLKRMGGLGQLVYIQRTVNKLNEDLKKRFKKNAPVVKIDPKIADLLAKAETNGEYDVFYAKIMQDIAAQVPPTFLDKWNAWRYMSMLFNPTTHVRNLTGNGIFLPAVRMKDIIALGMERFVAEDQRTKVLKVQKQYQRFAENDFEEVKDIITGSGKYNPSDAVSEYRRIFKNKVFENARKLNFDLLEKEDIIFLKAHYRHALGSFLQARKIDINNISTAQLVKAREYAINEALKATYRDASKVANMMSQLSKTSRGANIIIEGVLPFKKTPINIMKRGIEYSPIGLIKTLSKGIYDLKTEKITVSQFIDGLAAGTVGTGIFLIGALLSSLGVAKGGFDDDEEWFKKLNGEQEYSIEIGGKSYTVDWAAPSSIPFFMGVAISEYNADEDADILSMLYDFGMAGFEPIMSLSMLSGIEDVISSVSYAEEGQKLTTLVGSSIKSYFSQALPTIFGKVANVLDDTRRTSYIDKTSNIPEVVQQALDKIASKTPFASKTRAEYIDAWGNTKYTGNFIQRFFQQFVSPGYASTVSVTDVSEEISRLYKVTGEAGIYPSTPKKYVKFREVRKDLSQEEYYDYATFKGQRQADLVDEAIHSKEYESLTDEQKAEVIKDLYNYASVLAKCQLDYTYEEIAAMVGEDKDGKAILTKEKYNRLDDKARRLLVYEYFTESGNVVKAYKAEKNGKSVVEYFIKKIKKENK